MKTFTSTTRTLAIDPTTRGFAWVILEGLHTLVDWGTAEVEQPRNENSLRRIEAFMATYRPDFVVSEDCGAKGSRRSGRATALLQSVEERSKRWRVSSRRIPRLRVLEAFAPQASTKHEIAETLALHFPELRPRLPRVRKPWMSEDLRMNIFDALALAVTFAAEEAGELPVIKI